jgi:hypothetical protein
MKSMAMAGPGITSWRRPTILSTFGNILPDLAKRHQVIAVELQLTGTPDINRPLSF